VLYTRRVLGGKLVRRRECRNCGKRFSTWEKMVGLKGAATAAIYTHVLNRAAKASRARSMRSERRLAFYAEIA
jgi:transcriptional regulator NrdR family protein